MNDDPHADLKQHALTPERMKELAAIPVTKVSVSKKERKRREQFVMVPWVWVERLTKARHASTHVVAYMVLHLHWKRNGEFFTLTNTEGYTVGISRWQKWTGLQELEQFGLIRVVRRDRKSPGITVIVQP